MLFVQKQMKMLLTSEEVGDVLELGDVVLSEATVLDEEREDVVMLPARVLGKQLGQLAEHLAPGLGLLLGVIHVWEGLAASRTL